MMGVKGRQAMVVAASRADGLLLSILSSALSCPPTFALAGTADHVEAGMASFAAAGLDTLVVRDDPSQNPQAVLPVLHK